MQNKPNDTTGTTQKSTTGTEDILYDEENLHSSGESSLPKSEDDIAQLLVDKGLETKKADKAAEVVASFLSGESPTDAQLDVIASSKQAFELFGELFGTDIDLASKNALDVVTKRIAERAGRVGGDISSGMFKSSLYTDGKLDYSKIELEYMPSYNLAGYRSLMKQYYEAGKSGASIDSVQNSGDVRLTDEAKRAAYEAGKQSSDLTSGEDSGIVKSGAVSGARNPDGEKARIHAEKYYGLIRTMKTDVAKIAKTTGLSKQQIQAIKNFIFYEKHDLGGSIPELFAPDFAMGESWRRLILGKPEPHDITLIKHEIMESELMEQGYSQNEAHILASKKYNYGEETKKFYGKIEKYSD